MPSDQPINPFTIDERRLDTEWLQQASHARDAGHREADARHEHAQAKARLEIAAAKIKLAIRRAPEKYDLPDKPNIDQVDCTLLMQKEYQDLLDEVNVSKRDLDYATADTNAFLDRRKALERLVELLSLNYGCDRAPVAPTPAARETIEGRRRRAVRGDSE